MERGIKLPQSPSEWGFKGENYLLIIGIDHYANWKPLHNAVKDIRDISRMLTERYQFEAAHTISLIDDEATEDNIRQKLLEVKRSITSEDNLVILFSGHGHYDPDIDEGYWVPANARKESPSDYISNSDVLKWIRAIKTHHTLLVVDSCFSGTLVSQSRSEVLSEKYPSCRIFASGRKELVDDGVPGTNSPFAKAILSRLSHNTDRVMRASELIQNVTRIVESQAGQAPIEGRIKDAGDEGGEFVFHLKITEDEIWSAVIDANTAEEYAKYIDYYPDGHHVVEAQTKLSQLTDEVDWKRALELSSSDSLTQYLEIHPRGAHTDDALRRLEEIEENDAWQLAKTRNTVSAFIDYLHKYPSGKFETLARKNLDTLKQTLKQHEQQSVQDELKGIEDISLKTSDNKEQYKNLLNEAEGLYAQMAYEKCVEKYQQALRFYEDHYVPDRKFVEQRIASAKSRVGYVEFLEDGKEAVTSGNYALALEYFKKARNIDDTPKIREWVKHCELKLGINSTIPPPITQKTIVVHSTPVSIETKSPDMAVSVNKKSRGIPAFVWVIGVFFLVGIVYLIYKGLGSTNAVYNSDSSSAPSYDESATNNINNTEIKSVDEPTYIEESTTSQAMQNALLPADFIPGKWYCEDKQIDGKSMGVHPSFTFYSNGAVTYSDEDGSTNGTWQSVGPFLTVLFQGYIGKGNISEIDNYHLIWNPMESDGSSEWYANWHFTKSN